MVNVNLLPWRAELKRKRLQKSIFLIALLLLVIFGLVIYAIKEEAPKKEIAPVKPIQPPAINQSTEPTLLNTISIKKIKWVGYLIEKDKAQALVMIPKGKIVGIAKNKIFGIEKARLMDINSQEVTLNVAGEIRKVSFFIVSA